MGIQRIFFGIRVWLALAAAALAFDPALAAAEAPKAMERWQVFDARSMRTVDHSLWEKVLARYVVEVRPGVTRFAYAAVTPADRNMLRSYLAHLSNVDVDRLNQSEQLAFWLNAYNALLVKAVLDAWPVKSPNEAGGTLFSPGPWEEKSFRVYDIRLSLRDISDRIVRALWPDGLSIYGLACAAKGCPNLRAAAYGGA
ncbi:MAG TPA: DUF547 domain-containing protein, partial [Sphingomonadales bacterium]|nr:DUF547 domain-containing protein [Sphingomonadales bacterium]